MPREVDGIETSNEVPTASKLIGLLKLESDTLICVRFLRESEDPYE